MAQNIEYDWQDMVALRNTLPAKPPCLLHHIPAWLIFLEGRCVILVQTFAFFIENPHYIQFEPIELKFIHTQRKEREKAKEYILV